jgi:SAM-dependent methyltransferase
MSASEEMSSEFGTVASWSVDAARALGPRFHVPAGCRGSGGPAAMTWLLDRLPGLPVDTLLDIGAGIGGPAAFARELRGATVVPVEPEAEACEAARDLFAFESAAFGAAWCVGVLCTIPDHDAALREIARVLRPGAHLGMLVYARTGPLDQQPEGNNFPTLDGLDELYRAAGFDTVDEVALADLPSPPQSWQDEEQAVAAWIEQHHGDDPRWHQSTEQESVIGRLIASGEVVGHLSVLVRRDGATPPTNE